MKDGIIEDIFADDRTAKNLENFIWQTVDPSRVEEDNPFEALAGMAGSFGFGVFGDAEDEDEYEDCDCSEPDCDCDEEDEDYDDYEEYDDENGVSSEDENNQDDERQKISDESIEPSQEPVEDENEKEGILGSEEVSNNKVEL